MNFENVFELPAEDFYVEDNSGGKIDPQFSLVQMNGTIEKEMEQNDKGELHNESDKFYSSLPRYWFW